MRPSTLVLFERDHYQNSPGLPGISSMPLRCHHWLASYFCLGCLRQNWLYKYIECFRAFVCPMIDILLSISPYPTTIDPDPQLIVISLKINVFSITKNGNRYLQFLPKIIKMANIFSQNFVIIIEFYRLMLVPLLVTKTKNHLQNNPVYN